MRLISRIALLSVCAFTGASPSFAQETGNGADDASGIDWSVGLRGSYTSNSVTGGKAALIVAPEASLAFGGQSSRTKLSIGSELVVDSGGQARISDLHAGAAGSFDFDANTNLEGSITGSVTQADPDGSKLPVNTLYAPLVIQGDATGSASRQFGHIVLKGTLAGRRYIAGPTTLDDLSIIDNSADSYWQGGGTLRLSYELTPLLAGFIEGQASLQKFDAPSPTLLKYLDGRTYQLRGGVSYAQGSIISMEASVGRAWLDYVDPSLTDAPSWVYNASLTWRPDETLSLVGALETGIGPSTTVAGDTDVNYALTGSASYMVNPWLSLRSNGGWNQTVTLGTKGVSWGYQLGAGIDYRSSRHVVWSADYLFRRAYAPPAPVNDTHTATLSVKIQR
ncbi:MAG: outer membrane beta-barrel protein [Devosia sp.]